MARAGSPRRAGSVADIRTPIIVAEVTSRRRSGLRGRAARAIAYQETARISIEAIIRPVAISTQPASERTTLATTFWTPIRCAARAERPTPRTPATPSPMPPGDAVARHRLGRRRVERGEPAGRAPRTAVDRRQSGSPNEPRRRGGRARAASLDLLVDLLDLLGDARPRVARSRFARRPAHRLAAGRLEVDALKLLRQPLGVGRGHQHPVGAVGDHVGIARDRRGDHRRAGREGLGQDHAEALSGERRRAEHVGLVEAAPQLLAIDPARACRSATPNPDRRRSAPRLRSRRRSRSAARERAPTSPSNACSEDREALALLRPAHEQQPELVGARLRVRRAARRCRRRWG